MTTLKVKSSLFVVILFMLTKTFSHSVESFDNVTLPDAEEFRTILNFTKDSNSQNETKEISTEIGPTATDFMESTSTEQSSTTPDVLEQWKDFEKQAKALAKKGIKSLISNLVESSGSLNISIGCRRDGLKLISGLRDIKTWAFSFIDSSGKIIDGMLSGTLSSLGEYDQCLNIQATDDKRGKNYGKTMFTGKYCSLDIKPPLPPKRSFYKMDEVVAELRNFSEGGNVINEAAKSAHFFHFLAMRVGICVPSGCQPEDIQEVANSATKQIMWSATVKRCEVKTENEYTPLIIAVMTVMCFFGFLLLVGSTIDLFHYYTKKKIKTKILEIFVCFSIISNFRKLVDTSTSSGTLSCLHGFRFLSISWIILGHTYLNINYQLFRGLRKLPGVLSDFFVQAIINASVAVDTFFFIGGLLVCFVTVKVMRESKKPFSIPLYIIHRLFRFYPVYVVVILFIFFAPILGSGPVYQDTLNNYLDACYKNWWTNLLFVNNYIHTDAICLPQSWYVSCDMQLYLAALLVLLPLLRWPKVGICVAVFGIFASVSGTGIMTYVNDYPPTMLVVHPDIEQRVAYWANAYFKPYSHAGPYCLGLLVGYLLATNPKLKFTLPVRIFGWCGAIACNVAVLYGVHPWNSGKDPSQLETLLYSSLHRIAWAAGVAWVIVNCATGQGGVVNYILSWKCWIPLGRLTYCAYLIHPIVQISAVGNLRMRLQTEHFFAVWMYFGHLFITFGTAFATSMLIEAPFLGLEKMMLKKLSPKDTRPNSITEQENNKNKDMSKTNGHAVLTNGYSNGHAYTMNGHLPGTIGPIEIDNKDIDDKDIYSVDNGVSNDVIEDTDELEESHRKKVENRVENGYISRL